MLLSVNRIEWEGIPQVELTLPCLGYLKYKINKFKQEEIGVKCNTFSYLLKFLNRNFSMTQPV